MRYLYLILSVFLTLFSCTQEVDRGDPDHRDNEMTINRIPVAIQSAQAAPGMDQLAQGEVEAIITGEDGFSEGDIIYISQMGNIQYPNFSNMDASAIPYMYMYEYKQEDADWDENYNFETVDGRQSIDWASIQSLGSVGNSFWFYSMYFPGNTAKDKPRFSVATDQTSGMVNDYNLINFTSSDILGAFHATSGLYTRMRFRMFHLMVYLKVTLYVPIYKDERNTETGESSYSGFTDTAMEGAYLLNVYNNFTIQWTAQRSSDIEAPLTETVGNRVKSIKMYMHEPDTETIIYDFNVPSYYSGDRELDDVRAYNFSVLFPYQEIKPTDNLICFSLKDIDGSQKYYYFANSQIKNGDYMLDQGTIQQLYLYLPRDTNKTILVGAKILPWGSSTTDVTVSQQTNTFDQEYSQENND